MLTRHTDIIMDIRKLMLWNEVMRVYESGGRTRPATAILPEACADGLATEFQTASPVW